MSLWLTKGHENVIPAEAGIQKAKLLDSRFRGNDEFLSEAHFINRLYLFSLEQEKTKDMHMLLSEFLHYPCIKSPICH